MNRPRSTLLLLIRYCVIDAVLRSARCEKCPATFEDAGAESTAVHSLIQKRSVQAPQSMVIGSLTALRANVHENPIHDDHFDVDSAKAIDDPRLPIHPLGTHHSIFELSFAQLDKVLFWGVFCGMLAFTIVVDQVENYAHLKAEHSPNNRKFLSRINAELMMFGCVGLFLFVLKAMRDLPEDQNVLIEFVDILCSMGACGLIAVAGVMLVVRIYNNHRWKNFEKVNFGDGPITVAGPIVNTLGGKIIDYSWMTPMDYQVMAKRFLQKQHLPDDFTYSDYLNYTLCNNACDMMDVQWYTWSLLLLIVLCLAAVRLIHGTHWPNSVYIDGFLIADLMVFVSFLIMLVSVNIKHATLIADIRQDEKDLEDSGIKINQRFKKQENRTVFLPKELDGVKVLVLEPNKEWRATDEHFTYGQTSGKKNHGEGIVYRGSMELDDHLPCGVLKWGDSLPEGADDGNGWVRFQIKARLLVPVIAEAARWSKRVKFGLQFAALVNSFLVAFYFLHVQYNLTAAAYHWEWKPLLLTPLMVSLLILLPLITTRFTVTEAFISPDSDALDQTLSQITQLEKDFDYIRTMWHDRGSPPFTGAASTDEGATQEELKDVLRGLGMSGISKQRLHRVFMALDEDKSGTVTCDELIRRLEEQTPNEPSISLNTFSFSRLANAAKSDGLLGGKSQDLKSHP